MSTTLVQANQTLTGGGDTNNCTPHSGISPSLVAAIQGAAQCLGYGSLGRFQCQVAFSANNSACSQMSCFPGESARRHLQRPSRFPGTCPTVREC